jgi:hypothetical protein
MYTARCDRNFARAAFALEPHYGRADVVPSYPVTAPSPIAWWRPFEAPTGHWIYRTPEWIQKALERTARRWLCARGIRVRVEAVHVTQGREVLVHVHAYSRSAQRRVTGLAAGLAVRLERTLRASAASHYGLTKLVVSWGYDPRVLAELDAKRV